MGGPRSTIELHPLPERAACLTADGVGFKGGVWGSSKFSQEFEVFRFKFQGWPMGEIEMVLLESSTSTALWAEDGYEYDGAGGEVEGGNEGNGSTESHPTLGS